MQIGTIVMYNGQLCRIKEAVERTFFAGQSPKLYYTLSPVDREEDALYLPADQAEEKCRPLLTKGEIELMRSQTEGKALPWIEDRIVRSREYMNILREGDPEQLVMLIRCLLQRKTELAMKKKKLTATDEKILASAEKRIDEEFSYVLNLSHDELLNYFTQTE